MTAATLIESFAARGLSVLADGEMLRVSPSSALTEDERHAIRVHKAELLALLRSEPAEVCPICGRAVEEQRGEHYRHVWCQTPGHFDSWRALGGRKLGESPLFDEWCRRK